MMTVKYFSCFSTKELVTLTIAAEVSGDHMNAVNVVGLIICMTGISVHVISKALNGK